jgi:lactoylglutathione lyase
MVSVIARHVNTVGHGRHGCHSQHPHGTRTKHVRRTRSVQTRNIRGSCAVKTDVIHVSRITVQDLFEFHLTVSDLDRAIRFYRDVMGLQVAHLAPERQAAFLWIGSPGQAMLGLWSAGSAPQHVTLHLAFRVSLADVLASPPVLRTAGITPLDFNGDATDDAVVLAWMPAASVFFRDPDGHLLEYIAMLQHEPRPEYGVVPWRMWELMTAGSTTGQELSRSLATTRF